MVNNVSINVKAKETATPKLAQVSQKAGRFRAALSRLKGPAARAGNSVQRLAGKLALLRGGLSGAIGGIGRLAAGIGGIFAGGLAIGTLAITGLVGGLGKMREALEETADSGGSVGETAEENAAQISKAVDVTDQAVQKAQGVFGAFGDVGAGFIQKQGALSEEAATNADKATDAAAKSGAAIKDTEGAMESGAKTASRFGKALDRIGGAFKKAGNVILAAIAKAILPALEKFADFLESPVFQKFIEVLAKDLAGAAEKVANFFINKVIPAISNFMTEVTAAGGLVEWLRSKFTELKDNAINAVRGILDWFRNLGERIGATILEIIVKFSELKASIGRVFIDAFNSDDILASLGAAFAKISTLIQESFNAVFNNLLERFPFIEALLNLLNGGAPESPPSGPGGLSVSPTGLAPRDSGTTASTVVNIYVTVPANTTNAVAFGDSVAQATIAGLRRRGLRLPATV